MIDDEAAVRRLEFVVCDPGRDDLDDAVGNRWYPVGRVRDSAVDVCPELCCSGWVGELKRERVLHFLVERVGDTSVGQAGRTLAQATVSFYGCPGFGAFPPTREYPDSRSSECRRMAVLARNVTGTTLYVDSGYHAMGM